MGNGSAVGEAAAASEANRLRKENDRLRAERDEAVEHLKGVLRYAETARNSAGAGKNQAARLDAARDFLNQLTAGEQRDDG